MVPRGTPDARLYKADANRVRTAAQPWKVRTFAASAGARTATRFVQGNTNQAHTAAQSWSGRTFATQCRCAHGDRALPNRGAAGSRNQQRWGAGKLASPSQCRGGILRARLPRGIRARATVQGDANQAHTAAQPWMVRTFAATAGAHGDALRTRRREPGPYRCATVEGADLRCQCPRAQEDRALRNRGAAGPRNQQRWGAGRLASPTRCRGTLYERVFQLEYVRERPYKATRTRPIPHKPTRSGPPESYGTPEGRIGSDFQPARAARAEGYLASNAPVPRSPFSEHGWFHVEHKGAAPHADEKRAPKGYRTLDDRESPWPAAHNNGSSAAGSARNMSTAPDQRRRTSSRLRSAPLTLSSGRRENTTAANGNPSRSTASIDRSV